MDRSYFFVTAFFLVAAFFLMAVFLLATLFARVFLVAALFAGLPVLAPASRLAVGLPGRAPLLRPAEEARAERCVMVNRICSPTGW